MSDPVPPLRGVVPPVCTPLTPDLDVDVASLERLVGFLLDAGVHGLFALGSTGEVAFLPDAHRQRVLDTVVGCVAGQVPVLAGAIDMTTLPVLDHAWAAAKAGCDGVVVTAPFYTRTHPAEIERHFRLVAEGADLPVYAYDLPVAVHSRIPTEVAVRLASDGTLAGLKDSSGDDAGMRALAVEVRDRALPFAVLTGSELTADAALHAGAHGAVPGLANVDPHGYVRLYDACVAGAWDAAAGEQERLMRLFDIVHAGGTARMGRGSSALGAFKAALHVRGVVAHATTAPPQIPLTVEEVARVRDLLAAGGLA